MRTDHAQGSLAPTPPPTATSERLRSQLMALNRFATVPIMRAGLGAWFAGHPTRESLADSRAVTMAAREPRRPAGGDVIPRRPDVGPSEDAMSATAAACPAPRRQ
jgi:hypothetical protein